MDSFWKDLVLKQNATLIVNLCEDPGSGYSNDCMQYWPKKMDLPMESEDGTISVEMLRARNCCEESKAYYLRVTRKLEGVKV